MDIYEEEEPEVLERRIGLLGKAIGSLDGTEGIIVEAEVWTGCFSSLS